MGRRERADPREHHRTMGDDKTAGDKNATKCDVEAAIDYHATKCDDEAAGK